MTFRAMDINLPTPQTVDMTEKKHERNVTCETDSLSTLEGGI